MLDYIFYRVHKAYLRWDGKEGATSYIAIVYVILMFSLDAAIIVLDLLGLYKAIPKDHAYIFVVVITFITYKFVYRHYHNRYDEFMKKWANESKKQKTIRGIGVVIFLTLPLLISFIYVGCTGTFLGVNFLGKY